MIYTIDLLNESELHTLNNFYEFANFVDGSASGSANRTEKYNMAISDEIHHPVMVDILNAALEKHPYFNYNFMPNHHSDPVFLKYETGMHYGCHNDEVLINGIRTDYSITCFLNDPSEYEGGELILYIGDQEFKYKLEAGKALIYPTGIIHKVDKVTSGTRKVVVWWFESIIQNSNIRNILVEYSNLLYNIDNTYPIKGSLETIRHKLIREYAQFH